MASPKAAAVVADDIAEARALGLSTTPTFFINGRVLLGAQPFENFEKLIERELNRSPTRAKQ
jgi:protein-disulfide isomerase